MPRRPRACATPGFGLGLGISGTWLGLIVLVPLAGLLARALGLGLPELVSIWSSPRVLAALRLSFGAAVVGAAVNAALGTLVAWTFVRYRFPGKGLLDAAIDLPFALPTAVAGVALTALYAPNGWIGALLAPLGMHVAYTRAGIVLAMIFVGFPLVVRTVEPVLREAELDVEEAAATLGASRLQALARVVFPAVLPALLTGFTLALARGVGEYGSVIFIAGNFPFVSEIAPLLIVTKLEQFDYSGATAIALAMLLISFCMLASVNALQAWVRRRGATL